MGLIGDAAATPALVAALADADPVIQGRAAEALGQIADKSAAPAIGAMVAAHVSADALNGLNADDMGYPKSPAVEAVRLGIYALVRLGSYDGLAGALLDTQGRARSRWWPMAYGFQRVNDPRAAGVLLDLFAGEGQLTRSFAARGLAASKDPARCGTAVGRDRRCRVSRSRSGFKPFAASRRLATPAPAQRCVV